MANTLKHTTNKRTPTHQKKKILVWSTHRQHAAWLYSRQRRISFFSATVRVLPAHSDKSRPGGVWLCSWSRTRILYVLVSVTPLELVLDYTICRSRWHGRSSHIRLLFGQTQRSFCSSAPTVWNDLPSEQKNSGIKPCPHCRRKVRLSPKTARQRRNSATVALFCDSVTFLQHYHFSVTNCRTFLRQCGQAFSSQGFKLRLKSWLFERAYAYS